LEPEENGNRVRVVNSVKGTGLLPGSGSAGGSLLERLLSTKRISVHRVVNTGS